MNFLNDKDWTLWDRIVCKYYSFLRGLSWLKHYLFTPHNVIKIKTLPPTWCDEDELMLHACFQLLVDLIEKERIFHKISFEDPGQKEYMTEMAYLYIWWIVDRPKREERDPMNRAKPNVEIFDSVEEDSKEYGKVYRLVDIHSEDADYNRKIYEEASKFETECYEEDQRMFLRLANIRQKMWV